MTTETVTEAPRDGRALTPEEFFQDRQDAGAAPDTSGHEPDGEATDKGEADDQESEVPEGETPDEAGGAEDDDEEDEDDEDEAEDDDEDDDEDEPGSDEPEWVSDLVREMQGAGLSTATHADVKEAARIHVAAMMHFASGPEGALDVIRTLTSRAVKEFGEPFRGQVPDVDIGILQPEDMDEIGQALYGALQASQTQLKEAETRIRQMAKESNELVDRVTRLERLPALTSEAKRAYPGIGLSATQVQKALDKHKQEYTKQGVLNAVLLEHKDKIVAAARTESGGGDSKAGSKKGGAPPRPKGIAPDAGPEAKTIDMTNMSLGEMTRYMEKGYTHAKAEPGQEARG